MEDLSWIPSGFEQVKRSSDGYISGIVASEQHLVTLLENHRRATLTSFNAWSERLSDSSRRRLLWQVEEYADDVPLCVVKRVILVCQHGKPYSRSAAPPQEDSSEHVAAKKRIHVKKLQKLDCPAKLFIRHVTRYDTYSVKGESSRAKKEEAMKNLKQELSRTNPPTSTFIHVRVPLVEAHRNHTIDTRCCYSRRIHPKVRDKIQELVATGKKSLVSVREALEEYVSTELCEQELWKPHLEDRAYFPSDTTIQNHIRTALATPDRENLEGRLEEWEEEYYRDSFPLGEREEGEGEEAHGGGGERVRAGRKGAEKKKGAGRRNAMQRRVKSAKFAFRKELKRLIDDSYSCDDLETFRRSTEVLRNLRRSFLTQCRTEPLQLLRKEVMSGKDERVCPPGTQVNADSQSQNGHATRMGEL